MALKLTENAERRISFLISQESTEQFFRVAVVGGGCSGFRYDYFLTKDEPEEGDIKIDYQNFSLLIDEMSQKFLENAVMDFVENLSGSAFEIKNPQAESKCGCGNSFSVR